MKRILRPANLIWLVLAGGGIGLLLRLWLFATRAETTGLLAASHPAKPLLWLVTAAVVAAVVWCTKDLEQGAKYRFNFPASPLGALGCALGAASIGITSVAEWITYPDALTVVSSLLGILSASALVFLAKNRQDGQRQSVLYHTVICAYLMFRLVSQYRHWSGDPQLMDYCFQLLASVCLLLSVYQNAAFDVRQGNRKLHTIFHMGAVYFSCLSLVSISDAVFYLGTGIWMLTNICNLTPMPRQEAE